MEFKSKRRSALAGGAVYAGDLSITGTECAMDHPYLNDDERWAAVQRRAPEADGVFYYSVRSTGVYCRPSCGARPALRPNVAFHASCAEAEAAGFRPCLRCKPDQPPLAERHATMVAESCRLIDTSDELPDLDSLALAAGMSRFHFHRIFKAHTGITPKAYAAARRGERLKAGLQGTGNVTDTLYAAGFNSSGRFYAATPGLLGMTPGAFRSGGSGAVIRFAIAACSLGAILVASTDKGICAILIDDDPEVLLRDLQDRFPRAELRGAEADYEQTVAQVIGLVEAPQIGLDLPLDVRGTAFQQRVWQALREIPAGSTVTYAELAERVGLAGGGRNPLPPRGAHRRCAVGLSLGHRAQARAARTRERAGRMTAIDPSRPG